VNDIVKYYTPQLDDHESMIDQPSGSESKIFCVFGAFLSIILMLSMLGGLESLVVLGGGGYSPSANAEVSLLIAPRK